MLYARLVLFLIMCSLLSCNVDTNRATPQASSSVRVSKEKEVFISVLSPSKKDFFVQGRTIEIEDVWIEYVWFNTKEDSIKKTKSKQIVIKLKKSDMMTNYLVNWELKNGLSNGSSGNGNIIIETDTLTSPQYKLSIVEYLEKYKFKDFTIIDSIILINPR